MHAAADGPAALKILERIARPVDVLVTDIVMPGMDGRKLAERVVEQSPSTVGRVHVGLQRRATGSRGVGAVSRVDIPEEAVLADGTPRGGHRARRLSAETVDEPASPLRHAKSLTCLVADDHPAVLDAVSRYLETAGIAVLARVGRADEALQQIEAIRPATALIDIAIEPFNGLELAQEGGRPGARDEGHSLHREPGSRTAPPGRRARRARVRPQGHSALRSRRRDRHRRGRRHVRRLGPGGRARRVRGRRPRPASDASANARSCRSSRPATRTRESRPSSESRPRPFSRTSGTS